MRPLNTWNADSVTEELSILCVGWRWEPWLPVCSPGAPPLSSLTSPSYFLFYLLLECSYQYCKLSRSKLLTGKGICGLSLKLEAVLGLLAKDSEVVRCRFIKIHDAWEGHGDPTDMTYLFL